MIKNKVSFEDYKSELENMSAIDKINKIVHDMGCTYDFNFFYGVVDRETQRGSTSITVNS